MQIRFELWCFVEWKSERNTVIQYMISVKSRRIFSWLRKTGWSWMKHVQLESKFFHFLSLTCSQRIGIMIFQIKFLFNFEDSFFTWKEIPNAHNFDRINCANHFFWQCKNGSWNRFFTKIVVVRHIFFTFCRFSIFSLNLNLNFYFLVPLSSSSL